MALGQPMVISRSIRKFFTLALCAAALSVPASAARAPKPDSLDEVIRKVQLAQAKT